jgi:hypothetical protein
LSNPELLRTSLLAAVPLLILEIKARGGPDAHDVEFIRAFGGVSSEEGLNTLVQGREAFGIERGDHVLGAHGDELLYRSRRKGKTAHVFNLFARALAILSFAPGGVRFLGDRYVGLPPMDASIFATEGGPSCPTP